MIFGKEIGVDLGSSSTIVTARGRGVLLREPTVAAVDKNSGKLLGVGVEAQKMLGRTPAPSACSSPACSSPCPAASARSRSGPWWRRGSRPEPGGSSSSRAP